MGKKAKPEEPAGESAPMWIVSFADLVTLMMSFFVVLYALKQGGKENEISVAAAIATQFGWEAPMDPTNPYAVKFWKEKGVELTPPQKEPGRSDDPANGVPGKHPEVTTIRPGKDITQGGSITFGVNEAQLDPAGRDTVAKLIEVLKGKNFVLVVKGHVSSDEIALRPDDPNGMSLSYRRSAAVIDELVRLGIDRRVLRPQACGPFEPLKVGVYDAAGQRQNRRVEVFSTDTVVSDFFPQMLVPAATREGEKPGGKPDDKPAGKPGEKPEGGVGEASGAAGH